MSPVTTFLVVIQQNVVEVVVGITLTLPHPVNLLYTVPASNVPNKSQDPIQIEGFISFITLFILFYLNYCVSFYLYVIMSKSFRQEIKRTMFKCLWIPVLKETTAVPGTIPMRNLQTVSNRGLGSTNQFSAKQSRIPWYCENACLCLYIA
jgi:hypothetical protein